MDRIGELKLCYSFKEHCGNFSRPGGKEISFFVTHYDSKSQHLNLFARASCLLLGSLSAGIFSLWVLISVSRNWMGSTSATLPTWRQGCFFLTVGLNGLFIFTRNGNDLDGAVDNVSGEGWRLHTPRDRFSLLDEKGLEEMGKFFLATVQWLDTGRKEWHVVSRRQTGNVAPHGRWARYQACLW